MIPVKPHEALRVRKLAPVPMEHITLFTDGGVSGREMEGVAKDVVLFATQNELVHPLLSVRCVRVGHGGPGITQAPLRRKRGAPRQPGVTSHDVRQGCPRDEVIIQVAVVSSKIAVMPVVVVEFTSKVKGTIADCVVEKDKGNLCLLLPSQVKRDVFVERVGRSSIVTHRIKVRHPIALPGTVGCSRSLPQPEIHFVRFPLQVMVHAIIPPAEIVTLRGPIGSGKLPATALPYLPSTKKAPEHDR